LATEAAELEVNVSPFVAVSCGGINIFWQRCPYGTALSLSYGWSVSQGHRGSG